MGRVMGEEGWEKSGEGGVRGERGLGGAGEWRKGREVKEGGGKGVRRSGSGGVVIGGVNAVKNGADESERIDEGSKRRGVMSGELEKCAEDCREWKGARVWVEMPKNKGRLRWGGGKGKVKRGRRGHG